MKGTDVIAYECVFVVVVEVQIAVVESSVDRVDECSVGRGGVFGFIVHVREFP